MYVNQNPISQWDPGALMKAGQSSYFGKRAMGTVVNAKSLLNTMLSDILFNKKGKLDIKVYSKKGKELGRLTGSTTEDFLKGPEGYYVVGVEATSRTADSANYYRMAGPQEIAEILFNSAFKNLLTDVNIVRLNEEEEIFPAFELAYSRTDLKSTRLIEWGDYYNDK